jgi:two-component system phosphate regulon sensor histidine kinase PhoR
MGRKTCEGMVRVQIVGNLGENAVKFCSAGNRVRIGARREGDGGLVLFVDDDGPGIAREHVPRIKEAFVQVDTRLDRSYDGLGLGLYLVKSFLDLHGGRLEIHSEPGRGTSAQAHFPSARVLALDREDGPQAARA